MKYSSMLVDVQNMPLEVTSPVIEVVSMDALAKLAERHTSVILHQERDSIHQYFIQGDRITYRFLLDESGRDPSERSSKQQMDDSMVQKKNVDPVLQKPSKKRRGVKGDTG